MGLIDDFKREMIRSSKDMVGLKAAMFASGNDAGELFSNDLHQHGG